MTGQPILRVLQHAQGGATSGDPPLASEGRTLVGDERLDGLFPGWRDGVPPAGVTTITGSLDDVHVMAVGDTSHQR